MTALDPATTAVLTMELQRGICGDLAHIAPLRDAVAERSIEANTGRLLTAARARGATIVHCTFGLPADRSGFDLSLPLFHGVRDDPTYLLTGSPACELLAALGPDPGDVIIDRHVGVSPFAPTELDDMLRSRGVVNLVVAGVSLNVGVIGTAIEAVNLGYRVTIATDAVVGVPITFGDDVLRNALAAIARRRTVDEVVASLQSS